MIEKKYIALIEKLIEKTLSKKANWVKTSRETEYKISLKSAAITIDLWNDNGEDYADFIIRNDRGDIISQFAFAKTDEQLEYELLKTLHNLARENYYKSDETIEDIFNELNSDKEVGDKNESTDLLF